MISWKQWSGVKVRACNSAFSLPRNRDFTVSLAASVTGTLRGARPPSVFIVTLERKGCNVSQTILEISDCWSVRFDLSEAFADLYHNFAMLLTAAKLLDVDCRPPQFSKASQKK